MQGGHPDGLRFRFGRLVAEPQPDDSSGNESEVSVNDTISLGRRLDVVVYHAREAFGLVLALPVAWIQLQPNVESLRKHKRRRVDEGIESILWIQTFRSPVLDIVMQIFSFCAEEEFYLLILPLLFWNGWFDLARRLTFVVVTGLFVGNIIKDVFELPRPACPPVWRPSNQEQLDSTSLQDFGFPSTHAMNSVSNSLLVVWYFWNGNTEHQIVLISLAAIWISMLSISRMYLGAHTGTDVRGGLGLGIIVIGTYLLICDAMDAQLNHMTIPGLFACLMIGSAVSLLLCPQPRPPTPTFHQNAFIAGLLSGLLVGSKLADEYGLSRLPQGGFELIPKNNFSVWMLFALSTVRTVCGFILVVIVRQISKTLMALMVEKVLRINTKPISEVVKRRSKAKRGKKLVTRLFTRDVDIIAVAVVKMVTYLATAMSITFVFPYTWRAATTFVYAFVSSGLS